MLTILTSLIKNKARLYIEYALIALLVVTAGVTLTLWLQKESVKRDLIETKVELIQVEQRLTTSEHINKVQQQHIAELQNLRETDALALTGLLTDYKSREYAAVTAKRRLQNAEDNDATVKSYLDNPIPNNLACLLTKTCTGDPISNDPTKVGTPKASTD